MQPQGLGWSFSSPPGKGWAGLHVWTGERDGGRSSAEFCVADKVGPIPGISQVTLSRGSLDVPDSWDSIPDPQDLSSQSSDFSLNSGFRERDLQPDFGPPDPLGDSRSLLDS